jgi:hypothetical protein
MLIAAAGAVLLLAVPPATALADSSPVIESESAASVTATDATLEAKIDTNGLYTAYEFQIDTNAGYDYTKANCPLPVPGYAECESISVGEPLPAGLVEPSPEHIPAGSGAQSVSLDLASIGATLRPATTYHYRVIASSGGEVVNGPDQTFTTLPEGGSKPTIESVSISHLTPTDATLEARIDTEGLPTSYEFQMWNSPCSKKGAGCELIREIHLPSGGVLYGSFMPQSVSLDLNSAGVTLGEGEYGFSITAANAAGSASAFGGVFEAPPGVLDPPVPVVTSGPVVTPGPVGNEPTVPIGGGQSSAGGGQSSAGSGTPAPGSMTADSARTPSQSKGTTKHGAKAKPHKGKHKHKQHKPHKAKAGKRR